MSALGVTGLAVSYAGAARPAVSSFDCSVSPGEVVGLIGESGSGKSTVALAAMGLLPASATVEADGFVVNGRDAVGATEEGFLRIRGADAAMIFQEPMTALDPTMSIGAQISEAVRLHDRVSRRDARARAVELLELVQLPDAASRAGAYPHQLSGGQRQRVVIAIAMAARPAVLIADEPTTALDVTIQAEILQLLMQLKDETGTGILLITHDLGVVANVCDRVIVLYRGEIAETGTTSEVLRAPRHPYTRALIGCIPTATTVPRSRLRTVEDVEAEVSEALDVDEQREGTAGEDASGLLSLDAVSYRYRGQRADALRGVSFSVGAGRTLGIVGESGSGKSTVAKLVMGLLAPSAGVVSFAGEPLVGRSRRELAGYRAQVQMVFQDPNGSFDPRLPIRSSLREPTVSVPGLGRQEADGRIREALHAVGFDEDVLPRVPAEFSGGQRQRLEGDSDLVMRPRLIVLDEPTSALDVSVQAQVLNLLVDLQRATGVSYVFISHDLAVIRHMSHDVVVMKDGEIVERGSAPDVLESPSTAYTRRLLDSVPAL